MNRLLLLTYHFPPSAASGTFRMLGFARHLPTFGWRVSVVAPPETPWEPVDPELLDQVPDDTDYRPVPYPAGAPKVLRWAAPYAVWLPRAWSACKQALAGERFDAVLTSGPPHTLHLLGARLKRRYGIPWVADFRDPWINTGSPRPLRLADRWYLRHEKSAFAQADHILANAPNARLAYQLAHPDAAEKIVTLTNGFDPESFPSGGQPPRMGSTIRLLHAGELYAGRDPRPLLDALAAVPGIELELLGRVHVDGFDLGDEITKRGLTGRVILSPQASYEQALRRMCEADALVLFDGPGRKVGVPAKLYEYFGTRRPILALAEPDGDTANVVRLSGLPHAIAPPRGATAVRDALVRLSRIIADAPEQPFDSQALRQFTREHLAGRLASLLNRVAGVEECVGDPRPEYAAGGVR